MDPKVAATFGKERTWIRIEVSLQIYGKYITSDLVCASIKPRIKKFKNDFSLIARLVKEWAWSLGKGMGHPVALISNFRARRSHAGDNFEDRLVHSDFGLIPQWRGYLSINGPSGFYPSSVHWLSSFLPSPDRDSSSYPCLLLQTCYCCPLSFLTVDTSTISHRLLLFLPR